MRGDNQTLVAVHRLEAAQQAGLVGDGDCLEAAQVDGATWSLGHGALRRVPCAERPFRDGAETVQLACDRLLSGSRFADKQGDTEVWSDTGKLQTHSLDCGALPAENRHGIRLRVIVLVDGSHALCRFYRQTSAADERKADAVSIRIGSTADRLGLNGGSSAVGIEGPSELLRDRRSGGGLDGRTLHQVDQLAVAQDGDGG